MEPNRRQLLLTSKVGGYHFNYPLAGLFAFLTVLPYRFDPT